MNNHSNQNRKQNMQTEIYNHCPPNFGNGHINPIFPLGLNQEQYDSLFQSEQIDNLTLCVGLLGNCWNNPIINDFVLNELEYLFGKCQIANDFKLEKYGMSNLQMAEPIGIYYDRWLIEQISRENSLTDKWMIMDNMYLQVGFYDNKYNNQPEPASILDAMTVLDLSISYGIEQNYSSAIENPGFVAVEELEDAILYRTGVKGLFQHGFAEWNKGLVELRNDVLIRLRALMKGENPELALEEFHGNNCRYFLESVTSDSSSE